MRVIASLVAISLLIVIGLAGYAVSPYLMGVIIPYLAVAVFIGGIIYRVIKWAKSPVPFNIPTTCGQQKSLPWIENNELEAPYTKGGVLVRMVLEVFCFRSLFRNTSAEFKSDRNFGYNQEMFLWAAAIAFHYTFLVIVLRHFRFFVNPVPFFADWLAKADGFFEMIVVPTVYVTDLIILGAVGFLFLRRLVLPHIRYISLLNDYFPLLLILSIVLSGMAMRHVPFLRVDINAVKIVAHGLFSFDFGAFSAVKDIGPTFFVHIFLVSVLLIYFPFSKLMHMPGVFMSPTRNLANNSRAVRHVNPWNPDIEGRPYSEWEDEFRDLMKDADMIVEKD